MQGDHVQGQFHQFAWSATASPIDISTAIGNAFVLNGKWCNEFVGPVKNNSFVPASGVIQILIENMSKIH
jgi:hypothetical protein